MDESPPMSPATEKRRSKEAVERERPVDDVLSVLGIKKSDDFLQQEAKKRATVELAVMKLGALLKMPKAPAATSKTKWAAAYKLYKSGKLRLKFWDYLEKNPGGDFTSFSESERSKALGTWNDFKIDCEGTVNVRMQFDPQWSENSVVSSLVGGKSCVATRWNGYDNWVACAYFDGCITVFDVEENCAFNTQDVGCLKQMPGGEWVLSDVDDDTVACMNLRWCPPPNNAFLACTATGGLLCLWQVSQKVQGLVSCTRDMEDEFYGLDWTCDARHLIVGGSGKTVKAFDPNEDMKLVCGKWELKLDGVSQSGHANRIQSVRGHPKDPNTVFSAGYDRSVQLWDLRMQKHAGSLTGAVVEGDGLDVDNTGRYVLTAGQDGSGAHLDIWDVRSLNCVYQTGHESMPNVGPTCAGFSKDVHNKHIHLGGECDSRAYVLRSPVPGGTTPAGTQLNQSPLEVVASLSGSGTAFRCLESARRSSSVAYGTMDGKVTIVDYQHA
jgi:hypothetical protein